MVDENLRGFFLRSPRDERNPFCPLTAAEMVGEELAMVRRFERPLMMMGAASRRSTLDAAVEAGDPPLGGGSVQESLE
jgi:hypothetical protein